ncbi:MAG: lytic murein transglycosylase [Hyphomicrobiaceae bacterium]|nr:lytic murein transglycosylase [Hyphomicrobiaceae bacterium]
MTIRSIITASIIMLGALCSATGAGATQSKFVPNPPNCVNSGAFSAWMNAFRKEAASRGISQTTLARALDGIELDQRIIARDRKQGFFAQSFADFSKRLATDNRYQAGRRKIAQNTTYFERAQAKYGVPPEVITAFWALESDFGKGMGNFPVLPALATLAYDCRRGAMFREELIAALQIIERGDLDPQEMVGSWAGELGQTQFLPKHYLDHAVDFDGDGRINLFRSDADVIGSTAAFLKHLGWRAGEPWLQEVVLTKELPWQEADLAIKHPRSKWVGWGVRAAEGGALASDDVPASLLLPMGRKGPAFLAYRNFDMYTEWNQSLNYAATAGYLATRIGGAGPMQGRERDIPGLDAEQAKALQRILTNRGYDVGKIDGVIGAKSRAAIKEMQIKFGLPADSYPTPELLEKLGG